VAPTIHLQIYKINFERNEATMLFSKRHCMISQNSNCLMRGVNLTTSHPGLVPKLTHLTFVFSVKNILKNRPKH